MNSLYLLPEAEAKIIAELRDAASDANRAIRTIVEFVARREGLDLAKVTFDLQALEFKQLTE